MGMVSAVRSHTVRRRILQVDEGRFRWRDDMLCVEEPMEIRLYHGEGPGYFPVAVTMRTPGHDFELAVGFLFTEGVVTRREQVARIAYCTDPMDGSLRPEERYNIVNVYLRPGTTVDTDRLQRNFYTTSSCGVCGKASLEAIRLQGVEPVEDDITVEPEVLTQLGDRLRAAQSVFDRTGGLHAAAWFDVHGRLLALREDVGRHNAVDKLLGHTFLEGRVPLKGSLLMVSGRVSFEIIQKAAAAGVPIVAGISAPSSLACEAAAEFGLTLVGFLRGTRFNVYTGHHRIKTPGGESSEGRPLEGG